MIIAGLGFRNGCTAADLVAVVRLAESHTGLRAAALAAPQFKADHPALHEAAAVLSLPLLLVDDAALQAAQPRCPTRSAAAQRATGLASVAEAAALSTPGSHLLQPRLTHGPATCALATQSPLPLLSGEGRGEGVLPSDAQSARPARTTSCFEAAAPTLP